MINRLRNRLAGHPNGALLGIGILLGVIAIICILAMLLIMAGQWFFMMSPFWVRFGVCVLVVTVGIYWPLRRWLHDDTQVLSDNRDRDYYYTEEEVQS